MSRNLAIVILSISLWACSASQITTKEKVWYQQEQGARLSSDKSSIDVIHVHLANTAEDTEAAKKEAAQVLVASLRAMAERERMNLSLKPGGKIVEAPDFLQAWTSLHFVVDAATYQVHSEALGELTQIKVMASFSFEVYKQQLASFYSKKKTWADFYASQAS